MYINWFSSQKHKDKIEKILLRQWKEVLPVDELHVAKHLILELECNLLT